MPSCIAEMLHLCYCVFFSPLLLVTIIFPVVLLFWNWKFAIIILRYFSQQFLFYNDFLLEICCICNILATLILYFEDSQNSGIKERDILPRNSSSQSIAGATHFIREGNLNIYFIWLNMWKYAFPSKNTSHNDFPLIFLLLYYNFILLNSYSRTVS